jgi:hypothetical protein
MRLKLAKSHPEGEFRPGDRVKVVQRGSLKVDWLTLENNTFIGVTIASRNADGSYQVKGMVKTPDSDEVRVPAEWIEPL